MKNEIYKIGFEIEGGFTEGLMTKLRTVGEMVHDGSVRADGDDKYAREFNSVPYLLKDVNKALKVIDMFSDDDYESNRSAGFHIHFSFSPELPVTILSMQFFKYFKEKLTKDWPDIAKERGANSYCKLKLSQDDLQRNSGVERYRAINTWPSYRERKTIEFRIWPTAKKDEMKKYLLWNIDLIKNWLDNEETLATVKQSFQLSRVKKEKPIERTIFRIINSDKINYVKCVN